ncbi:MAG TPA: amidohydrolase [Pseudonocardia sp.]|nr:amidohydrolase [Pseudonocardia sp.]
MSAADLIVIADTVHTLDPAGPPAQAVAIADGLIVALGERRDAAGWTGPHTQVVDLGPAVLTPGLVDGHIHPVFGIDLTTGIDLSPARTLDQLRSLVRTAAERLGPDDWFQGYGLDPNAFGDTPVTAEPLIEVLADRPALVMMFDAHSAVATPAALARAGITGPCAFDGGASIVCDADGVPTGHLLEIPAYQPVRDVLPAQTAARRRARFVEILTGMAATGITAGNVMDFADDSADLVAAAERDGELPIRLRFAPFCMPGATRAELDHIAAEQGRGGRRWQVEGVKFFIDGTVDGGTAWLEHADSHGESRHPFWPDPAEYSAAIKHLAGLGVPTVTHSIGDRGTRYVLGALSGLPVGRVPHRVEHVETLPAELVARFAEQGVVASMQPLHCTRFTRGDRTDNWSQRLGRARAERAWCARDLHEAGAVVALGSDWPIGPYDARWVLADAQLRRRWDRPEDTPIVPTQALTPAMALAGYTTHAARANGLADRSGTIGVGKRADLTAFTVDPLTAPPDELAVAPIALTAVAGDIVHHDPAAG